MAQGGAQGLTIAAAIKRYVREGSFDEVEVAAAYVTKHGVDALFRILGGEPPRSRWVVGLDDAVTQPEAIDKLSKLNNSEVRLAKLSPRYRFHPKVFRFHRKKNDESVLVVGSGNLTEQGLSKNAECAVLMRSENHEDVCKMKETFENLWSIGRTASNKEILQYRDIYNLAKIHRAAIEKKEYAPKDRSIEENLDEIFSEKTTSESVIALAVTKLAASEPDGVCTLDLARKVIPMMIPLTSSDMKPYQRQSDARWVQKLRNIQSNSNRPGPKSTNFIALGYLTGVGQGYKITDSGRAMLYKIESSSG